MIYGSRIYYAAPGKMDALHRRFRDHTCDIFQTHGIKVIGFWNPQGREEETLIYMLAFRDAQHMKDCWDSFGADPRWKKVRAESEADGELIVKIESSIFLPTDYSPIK